MNIRTETIPSAEINEQTRTKLKIFEEQKLFYTSREETVRDVTFSCHKNHPVKYLTSALPRVAKKFVPTR